MTTARVETIAREALWLSVFAAVLYLGWRELHVYDIKALHVYIVTVRSMICSFLVFAALRFSLGAGWACLFAWFTTQALMIDQHLGRNFTFLFGVLGKQLILVLRSTCATEVYAYLGRISRLEYLSIPAVAFFWMLMWRLSTRRFRKPVLILLAVPPFYWSYDYLTVLPVYEYLKELNNNGAVLRQHDDFKFNATDGNPGDEATYVILLGETHRYDHFHVFGYPRETTPVLDQWSRDPGFLSFDDVLSGYTLTQQALPVILTRKPIAYRNNLFGEKSIISAFREAGFTTYYITYLDINHPFEDGNAVIGGETEFYLNSKKISGTWEDPGQFAVFEQVLREGTGKKKLFVLKMLGVHYNFEERYTPPFEKFKPSFLSEKANEKVKIDLAHKDMLVNSYDNAILFSDAVIGRFLDRVKALKGPAMLAFISDHGSTLFEDGKTEDRGLAKGNYHVPFFVYGNPAFWPVTDESRKSHLACNRRAPITQEYFFDTFMSLAKINWAGYRPGFDLSDSCVKGDPARKVWTLDGRFILYDEIPN